MTGPYYFQSPTSNMFGSPVVGHRLDTTAYSGGVASMTGATGAPTMAGRPLVVMTEKQLLAQGGDSVLKVLTVVHNELEKENLINVVATPSGYDRFNNAVRTAKLIVEDKNEEMDQRMLYLKEELAKCEKQKEVTQAMMSPTGTIAGAEVILALASHVKRGTRPEKLTQKFLVAVFTRNELVVSSTPTYSISERMFLATHEAILGLPHDESLEAIKFLDSGHYSSNQDFKENLEKYKALGIIGEAFPTDCILGSIKHTTDTLQGLLAIYLDKLPPEAESWVFIPQKKTTGPDLNCWTEKAAPTVGVASAADGGSGMKM